MIANLQAEKNIEALITSNLRKIENDWMVSEFDPSPFFVIVK